MGWRRGLVPESLGRLSVPFAWDCTYELLREQLCPLLPMPTPLFRFLDILSVLFLPLNA